MLEKNYKPTHRVFMFSGGSTSAYMVLNYHQVGDIVIFADTGREHPLTYKFVDDFERFTDIEIHRTSYKNSTAPFDLLLSEKGYKVLPNLFRRFCTIELKIKPIKAYLKSMGILQFEQFVGFRFDEPHRVQKRKNEYKKVVDRFPLYDDRIVKADVDLFWSQQNFRLEVPRILGNCSLCFMKGKNAIIRILSQYPELAQPWINDEEFVKAVKPTGVNTYLKGASISSMLLASQQIKTLEFDLSEVEPAYNCACTS